jgi:beta-xylosidase
VLTHAKPKIVEPDRISWRGKLFPIITPAETDEFNSTRLGLQWQWQANPKEGWAYTTALGFLKMFSVYSPDSVKSAYDFPNILTQKFPAETFKATVKLDFKPRYDKERFGVIIYGTDYAAVYIQNKAGKFFITYNECSNADKGKAEEEVAVKEVSERLRQSDNHTVYLRVSVSAGAVCHFSFSEDGENFTAFEKEFIAKPGRWVGAKIGMFCSRNNITNDAGSVDIDWLRIEPLQ